MKNLLLMMSLVLASTLAQADTLKLQAKVVSSNGVNTYTMAANGTYYIQSMQGQTQTDITTNKTQPQSSVKSASESMPDSSKGEYTVVTLQKQAGNQGLLILDITQSYEGQLVRFYQPVEIEVTSGSWADYDNGSTVRLALTAQGRESMTTFKKSLAGRFGALLSATLQQDGSKLKKFELNFEGQATGVITASKTTLIMSGSETRFNVKVEVGL